MIRIPTFVIFAFCCSLFSQQKTETTFSITPEILIGITGESNTNFPDRKLQKQALINLGWHHTKPKHHWNAFLKTHKSGISLGYTDLGNTSRLGHVLTLQPFLEFNTFKSQSLKLHVGTGVSYITEKYNPETNPFNQAVSTDLTWAFRLFFYYNLLNSKQINWRVGGGYSHNSNGHTKLPNQGFNSFLFSLNAELKTTKRTIAPDTSVIKRSKKRNYLIVHTGYGINVLSKAFDEKTAVYTAAAEYGKIFNNTFKVGISSYFRFYEAYYDYISTNQSLVQDGRRFESLRENPFRNATNIGISVNGEVFFNHFGIDLQFGVNLYKPSYKLDWRINQGWGDVPRVIPEEGGFFRLGDTDDFYFKVKRTISARLGLKYYFLKTAFNPKHNVYVGAFINSNLGQADFTEFALGYLKVFKPKSR